MTPLQKIRTSFTTQLSLWVAGFVVLISTVVIALLASFSEEVIRDETIDATLQVLENTALRIDNTMRQREITARLENQSLRQNRSRIERLIEESGSLAMLQQSLPHVQLSVARRDSSQFDTYIIGDEGGYRQLMYDDKDMYLFSQPIGDRQFNLVAFCPAEDIYGKYSRMQWILVSWGIASILALLLVLYLVIARHLRPLHLLADSAQSIAQGPLNKQHAELQAAYNEAQIYEEKKGQFLHDMTIRMTAPVEQLCRCTDTICRDYFKLSKNDMAALQSDIMQGSETITELLDQLIKDPAGS